MENDQNVVCFIFARGGSKGVKRKNLRRLAGKPLLLHTIDLAKGSKLFSDIIVSTDDKAIADCSLKAGVKVPFLRPKNLADDNSPEILSWKHALKWYEDNVGTLDVFVSLPATAPFRSVDDIKNVIQALMGDPHADIVVTVKKSNSNPYFNIVTLTSENYVKLALSGEYPVFRRQDAPLCFEMTTVAYAARPQFVTDADSVLDGKVRMIQIPESRALDIDSEQDFLLAEALCK